jgi:hypothetical protein
MQIQLAALPLVASDMSRSLPLLDLSLAITMVILDRAVHPHHSMKVVANLKSSYGL